MRRPKETLDARASRLISAGLVRTGISGLAYFQARYRERAFADRGAQEAWLADEIETYAIQCYEFDTKVRRAEFTPFNDGIVNYLFADKEQRMVLTWGRSSSPSSGRDDGYLRGAPMAGKGFDKGHMWSHGQGGSEGGQNLFKQASFFNRGWSEKGKLWRRIEAYLSENPGTFAFVRLVWVAGNPSNTRPDAVEYGLVPKDGQLRSAIFENSDA